MFFSPLEDFERQFFWSLGPKLSGDDCMTKRLETNLQQHGGSARVKESFEHEFVAFFKEH